MKIGYFGANVGAFDDPDAIARLGRAVEDLGFESLWTGEHVVLVDPQRPPSPVPPHAPFVDTVATLAFLAAKTERILLGSGIILLAQRQPIVLAKELAGIDVLSKGRLSSASASATCPASSRRSASPTQSAAPGSRSTSR